jgi:hypothetical protein
MPGLDRCAIRQPDLDRARSSYWRRNVGCSPNVLHDYHTTPLSPSGVPAQRKPFQRRSELICSTFVQLEYQVQRVALATSNDTWQRKADAINMQRPTRARRQGRPLTDVGTAFRDVRDACGECGLTRNADAAGQVNLMTFCDAAIDLRGGCADDTDHGMAQLSHRNVQSSGVFSHLGGVRSCLLCFCRYLHGAIRHLIGG